MFSLRKFNLLIFGILVSGHTSRIKREWLSYKEENPIFIQNHVSTGITNETLQIITLQVSILDQARNMLARSYTRHITVGSHRRNDARSSLKQDLRSLNSLAANVKNNLHILSAINGNTVSQEADGSTVQNIVSDMKEGVKMLKMNYSEIQEKTEYLMNTVADNVEHEVMLYSIEKFPFVSNNHSDITEVETDNKFLIMNSHGEYMLFEELICFERRGKTICSDSNSEWRSLKQHTCETGVLFEDLSGQEKCKFRNIDEDDLKSSIRMLEDGVFHYAFHSVQTLAMLCNGQRRIERLKGNGFILIPTGCKGQIGGLILTDTNVTARNPVKEVYDFERITFSPKVIGERKTKNEKNIYAEEEVHHVHRTTFLGKPTEETADVKVEKIFGIRSLVIHFGILCVLISLLLILQKIAILKDATVVK